MNSIPYIIMVFVGFSLFAVVIASGSMGAAFACFALLCIAGAIGAIAGQAPHASQHGVWRDRARFTDSGDPDDPLSIHYDPSRHHADHWDPDRWDSMDPHDPTSVHYDPDPFQSLDASDSGTDWDDSMGIGTGSSHSLGLGNGFDDPFESGIGLGSDWDD